MTSTRELLAIQMAKTDRIDVNSGVARMSGAIWATHWFDDVRRSDTVFLVVHPASNFLGHYLLKPLADAGASAVGLATRYIGNDQMLLMENCVLDVGSAISHLRDQLGYERVVLVGNSGGGGLAAMYQSQADEPTITATPAGDPPDLTKADLPPADGLVMLMAHPGRAIVYTESLDPAIVDEHEPFRRDPVLDMFNPDNGPPYSEAFLARYRAAQLERNRRITRWVRSQLDLLTTRPGPAGTSSGAIDDLPFTVHGTSADPRTFDALIEGTHGESTTLWGGPWKANYSPVSLGHASSLRSWLSQWSYDDSRANALKELPHVRVPVSVIYGSGDYAAYPSHAEAMFASVVHDRKTLLHIEGAHHYFMDQPEKFAQLVEFLAAMTRG